MNLIQSSKHLVVSALIAGSLLIAPLRASAIFVPITDPLGSVLLVTKEYGLDFAAKLAANAIQQIVIQSLQQWILSGFEGNPSFVVNPRDLVSRVEENAAGVFQRQLANANVCDPYRAQVNRAVARAATERGDSVINAGIEIDRETACVLQQIVRSGVIDNYTADGGFVNEGGYAPLIQAFGNLADDPAGAEEVAIALQKKRQAEATLDAEKEVDRGNGFESMKECVDGDLGSCLRFEVQTPGKSVGELLDKSLGQSFDQLAAADELSEIVIGFISALTSQAINGLR
jgi:hypothetical protein